jgi:hypothetical protein
MLETFLRCTFSCSPSCVQIRQINRFIIIIIVSSSSSCILTITFILTINTIITILLLLLLYRTPVMRKLRLDHRSRLATTIENQKYSKR